MAERAQLHERPHPTPLRYAGIAVVLAVITLVEVWVYYQEALRNVLLPVLLVLSTIKFALVALFFMHLKFDSRLFSYLFVGGLILATSVLFALMALFQVFAS